MPNMKIHSNFLQDVETQLKFYFLLKTFDYPSFYLVLYFLKYGKL